MHSNIKGEFYKVLLDEVDNVEMRKEIALFGNFNAWTCKTVIDKDVGQYEDARTNNICENVIQIIIIK